MVVLFAKLWSRIGMEDSMISMESMADINTAPRCSSN